MATFTGTSSSDTITTYQVSPGVKAVPAGSIPSVAPDTIDGLGGADTLSGGGGADTINGGDGDDVVADSGSGNTLHGNGGNDDVQVWYSDTGGANVVTNSAFGDVGNDEIWVSYGSSNAEGTWVGEDPTGSLLLQGGAGNDDIRIFCEPNLFSLDTSKTTSAIYGDAGDDYLSATALDPNSDGSDYPGHNTDTLYGGTGDDRYFVLEAKDVVVEAAGEGTDTVIANQTDYTLPANAENLTMQYNTFDFPDPSIGWSGTGNALPNVITGAFDMVDRLNGLGGDDTIYGGLGDVADVLRGGSGNDRIYGGETIDDPFDGSDKIYGDDGNDDVWAGNGDDAVEGGAGNDNLYGQSGNDTMRGGLGDERVYGGTGNDTLLGDGGADAVRGGEGLDKLAGGGGSDRFDYDAVTDSMPGAAGRDVISDFAGIGDAAGDWIDLATIDSNNGLSGNQAFKFMGTGMFTGAGQVRVAGSGSDTLIQANTGGSLSPELEIAVQDAGVQPGQWAASDFIL